MKSNQNNGKQKHQILNTSIDSIFDEAEIKAEIDQKSNDISKIQTENEILHQQNFLLTQKFQQTCSYNQQLGDELANFQDEIIIIQSSNQKKKEHVRKLTKKSDELKNLIDSIRNYLLSDRQFKVSAEKLKKIEGKKATLLKKFKALRGDDFQMNNSSLLDKFCHLNHSIFLLKERQRDLQEHIHVLNQITNESIPENDRKNAITELTNKKEREYVSLLDELKGIQNHKINKPRTSLQPRRINKLLNNKTLNPTKELQEAEEIISQMANERNKISQNASILLPTNDQSTSNQSINFPSVSNQLINIQLHNY